MKKWTLAESCLAGVSILIVCACGVSRSAAQSPKVSFVNPAPARGVVDDQPFDQISVSFDTQVVVPPTAVTVRTLNLGKINAIVSPLNVATNDIIITFPAVSADLMTLVLDHTIADNLGNLLDGEIADPHNADLSSGSGDGSQGGQAVFVIHILQGDANRDGFVDVLDSITVAGAIGTCIGNASYVPEYDLDLSGCIDSTDSAIVSSGIALGNALPTTDAFPPSVADVVPTPSSLLPFPNDELVVVFDQPMDVDTIGRTLVYGVGVDGSVVIANDPPLVVNDQTFVYVFDNIVCLQDHSFTVNNSASDPSGNLIPPATFAYTGVDTEVPTISCPMPLFVDSVLTTGIPAGDVLSNPSIMAFLSSVAATDGCSAVTIASDLDTPFDLRLGVTDVTFTAMDSVGNIASCDAPVIVVPAQPIKCWDTNENGVGDSVEDTNGDGLFDVNDCQGPQGATGSQGPSGATGGAGTSGSNGSACWDLNENGVADDEEDQNGDDVIDIFDCRGDDGVAGSSGATGQAGPEGPTGPQGSEGPQGPQGLAGQDAPSTEPTQPIPDSTGDEPSASSNLCGAFGLISYFSIGAFLCLMRGPKRYLVTKRS